MRLRMKPEYEVKVMKRLFLAKAIDDSGLRLTDLVRLTKIPKGTLPRILQRLKKRGWIKKYEDWERLQFTPSFLKFFTMDRDTFEKYVKSQKGSSYAKKTYWKKTIQENYVPKKSNSI